MTFKKTSRPPEVIDHKNWKTYHISNCPGTIVWTLYGPLKGLALRHLFLKLFGMTMADFLSVASEKVYVDRDHLSFILLSGRVGRLSSQY